MKTDIYAEVTDKVLASLESGTVPWVRPWSNEPGNSALPYNAASNRAYSGINTLSLMLSAQARGFPRNGWMTYKQAQEIGAQVRKGAKAEHAIYWKQLDVADNSPSAEPGTKKKIPLLRCFNVFNLAEIENLPAHLVAQPPAMPSDFDRAEKFCAATGAVIEHGSNQAAFIPSADKVTLPNPQQFKNSANYYATKLHELVHWSGAKSRLERTFGKRFSDDAYAVEELVAEMGSAFLCAHLGIDGELQHPSYLAHWVRILREDNRAIFKASAEAAKAADYLRQFSEPKAAELAEAA